jgi:excisionase family DNA binding protein
MDPADVEASNRSGGHQATALLTADELAARWKVPTSQVYRQAREGKVPAVRIGRYYRFSIAAIEAYERGS